MSPPHKVLILGTGRAGTTFLVQLLTSLGIDTGLDVRSGRLQVPSVIDRVDVRARAGLEARLEAPESPYLIKDPTLSLRLDKLLTDKRLVVDHALIAVRDLDRAANSRIRNTKLSRKKAERRQAGTLFGTDNPADQREVLVTILYNLIVTLANHEVEHTIIHYPRMLTDPEYLRRRLLPVVEVSDDEFRQAFSKHTDPALIARGYAEATPPEIPLRFRLQRSIRELRGHPPAIRLPDGRETGRETS